MDMHRKITQAKKYEVDAIREWRKEMKASRPLIEAAIALYEWDSGRIVLVAAGVFQHARAVEIGCEHYVHEAVTSRLYTLLRDIERAEPKKVEVTE